MRYLYTILLYLATPFIMLRLLYRSIKLPAYRKRWSERFGHYNCPRLKGSIWLHCVSVGEFIAALPMVKAIMAAHPDRPVVITTTTPTGSEQVMKHFGDSVTHVYSPYDLPHVIKRFLKHMDPKVAVILETELWPNLLHTVNKAGIPILLANARLSDRSKEGYGKISGVTRNMLSCFHTVAAQSEADGQRFVDLGLPASRLNVAGNIKFDLDVPEELLREGQKLRHSWGDRPVWVVASTHEGEESVILDVFDKLKGVARDLLLVLVPRHPDRFDRVYKLCTAKTANVVRRSEGTPVQPITEIMLGDTMGEMKLFLAAANYAFVAGSIVPVGGHNLIEPAILGVPVLTGHFLHNFIAISKMLLDGKGLLVSHTPGQLYEQMADLIKHPEKAKAYGERAQAVILKNKGALDRHLQLINNLLGDS